MWKFILWHLSLSRCTVPWKSIEFLSYFNFFEFCFLPALYFTFESSNPLTIYKYRCTLLVWKSTVVNDKILIKRLQWNKWKLEPSMSIVMCFCIFFKIKVFRNNTKREKLLGIMYNYVNATYSWLARELYRVQMQKKYWFSFGCGNAYSNKYLVSTSAHVE
jgi:hypothetical protein